MLREKVFFWKASVYIVLLIALFLSFAYFQKGAGQKDRHVFLLTESPLIALDRQTFENETTFERATFITASAIDLKSILRHFTQPIEAMTATQKPQKIVVSQGFNLIQISPNGEADRIFNLAEEIKSPLVALSPHTKHKNKLYGVCKNKDVLMLDLSDKKPIVKTLATSQLFPETMTLEEMWPNPLTPTLIIALSQNDDSLLIELDPENWNQSLKELMLPRQKVKGGFYLSKHLMVTIDEKYTLSIIDWEKQLIIGKYSSNQNFQDPTFYTKTPKGMVLFSNMLYLTDDQSQLMALNWKPNTHVIVLNRDVVFEKGKVVLHWKLPTKDRKVFYFAELSLIPRSLASVKKKTLPLPPEKTLLPYGPLKKSSLEMPLVETVYRSFDVSLFAIHSSNGKIVAPASTFTIDTEKRQE
ncbi:MAG: hypothetical protein HYY61_07245 [Deltaproteobacteria bacterium]|nr:hypothetical protein [Deltaproteobacteria bacterium]